MGLCIGNFSADILPESVREAIGEDIPMYGVKFNGVNSAGVRTYDAATLTWAPSTNSISGIDNFSSLAPFNVKEVCRVYDSTNGTNTFYYKDDYSDSEWNTIRKGTHATISGDIMIEIPSFYYYRPSKFEIIVAPAYKFGFNPSPAHYRNGKMLDKIYVSKYNINNDYKSLSGYSPRVSTNMNTFRTNLRNRGMNMIDYPTWCSLVMLMLVKYANMNVQATVSEGRDSGNATIASGGADNVKGWDGSATGLGVNEPALTMGIENFYGNVWKYIDGLYGYNGNLYIKDMESITTDPASTTDLATFSKILTTYPSGASNSAVGDIAFDSSYDYMIFPTATSGNNPASDGWWSNYNLNCVFVGGNAWNGSAGGLFAFYVNAAVGYVSVSDGSLGLVFP